MRQAIKQMVTALRGVTYGACDHIFDFCYIARLI